MIISLKDARANTSGGKASALGALLDAGLPVPESFVVPFDVYRAACRGPGKYPFPDGFIDALAKGLDELGDAPVAVRSSANSEDTVHASGAGQHESILGVRGTSAVADAIRSCWASLHSSRAVSYRESHDEGTLDGDSMMAVLVQRLVDADASGIMFTPAAPEGITEIEASWGLGPSVVGGTVTPDAYRVGANGSISRSIADKRTRLDRNGTRLIQRDVPALDRNRETLNDSTVAQLVRLGQETAATLGSPQDIEWAITGDQIWILQARPITATPPPIPSSASHAWLNGTPASRGTATGTARVVRGPGDFAYVEPGDILICPFTDPAWTPLLRIVAGVVTETGGVLSHAAIVARELNIPAVLGVPNATTAIHDGVTITIDGAVGTVSSPDSQLNGPAHHDQTPLHRTPR